jgi:hypothetical protein
MKKDQFGLTPQDHEDQRRRRMVLTMPRRYRRSRLQHLREFLLSLLFGRR